MQRPNFTWQRRSYTTRVATKLSPRAGGNKRTVLDNPALLVRKTAQADAKTRLRSRMAEGFR